MLIITDTAALAEFCAGLRQHPYVAVDTEFMREKTYFSQLCLIQAASPAEAAIIDPLADGLDLAPFLEMLADPAVTKVFHAARQDVEIFFQIMQSVPQPLFDTQIAAMACGYGDQIGYEPLVRTITGKSVDKGSRFTDWSRRPLSDRQLEYAIGDVTHLRDVYDALSSELARTDRLPWVMEEMEALLSPSLYFVQPENAWKRLKLRNTKRKELGPLIKIAEWREAEAQKRDVPRARILKDDALFELARQTPESPQDLARARGIPNGFERSGAAKGLLGAITDGKNIPKGDLPDIDRPRNLPQVPADVLDLLRVLLARQCKEYDVAPKLIASVADLEEIARDDNADVPAMKGWRREVFGDAALKLKHGKLAMKLTNGTLDLIET
ncbi:ribonuclease D [Aquisalinus flavus]|uniref:Ribonuclease D n=1 Tax=Aquisalinus flavus TaxID=1526572 RepID=A0A8J2V675_9PROT|nr:ribonuclease D [Aquisalinus flavus]MBD0427445.1 ribonuclease D [Aquisalinus flavus]UNE47246.1 ribonuclease D [Aquisalinus flavus]GGD01072.1 ribonuclease D [Aquisalinus flavus]